MSKRDIGGVSDGDSVRVKRRKDAVTGASGAGGFQAAAAAASDDAELVRGQGTALWDTIRTAVNKEQRVLSEIFALLPNKRQYPDYYVLITQPISLDMIRDRLDHGQYQSLAAVKADIDLCFINAKQYNLPDSQVYKDARSLLKLTKKEYTRITGIGEEASDDEGKKKDKSGGMFKLCRNRLQKLVETTDDSGRIVSTEFMELPSKKLWPVYYVAIKRPICFNDIFKHLKRKEYATVADFAKDVELVFDNAHEFNNDDSPVGLDAQLLRTTFAKLMADMPEPFALPQYTSPSVGKIKLKRPGAPAAATTAAPAPAAVPTPPPAPEPTLPKAPATVAAPPTLPQASASKPSAPAPAPQPALPVARATVGSPPPAKTPARAPAPPPAAVRTPLPKAMPAQRLQPKPRAPVPAPTAVAPGLPYMPAQAAPAPAPVPMPMPVPATPTPSAHYPNAAHYSAQTASAPYLPVPKPTAPSAPLALPVPPPTAADRPLSRATVVLAGSGRVLRLTTAAGVRAWHVRLAPAEPGLTVSGLGFLYDEPVDEAMDVDDDDASPRTKKKKGKRGKKTKDAQPPAKPRVRATVRLNETVLAPLSGKDADEWYITPAVGAFNVVEMGSEGGAMWRLYVDRAQ